jgi:hypothetical protein
MTHRLIFVEATLREAQIRSARYLLEQPKGGTSLIAVKLMPPLSICSGPKRVCLISVIAVTFGTATSSSKDAGFVKKDSKTSFQMYVRE